MDLPDRGPGCERVVVIGGGVTGLSAAHRLFSRLGLSTTNRSDCAVLGEGSDRGGSSGPIGSTGSPMEVVPTRSSRTSRRGPGSLSDLGLATRSSGPTIGIVARSWSEATGSCRSPKACDSSMHPTGLVPLLSSPILSLRGKLRMLMDLVLPRKSDESDEISPRFCEAKVLGPSSGSIDWSSRSWAGFIRPIRPS